MLIDFVLRFYLFILCFGLIVFENIVSDFLTININCIIILFAFLYLLLFAYTERCICPFHSFCVCIDRCYFSPLLVIDLLFECITNLD